MQLHSQLRDRVPATTTACENSDFELRHQLLVATTTTSTSATEAFSNNCIFVLRRQSTVSVQSYIMGQLLTLMVLGDMVAASAGKQGQRQQPGRSAAGNSSSRAQLKTATKKMTRIAT